MRFFFVPHRAHTKVEDKFLLGSFVVSVVVVAVAGLFVPEFFYFIFPPLSVRQIETYKRPCRED